MALSTVASTVISAIHIGLQYATITASEKIYKIYMYVFFIASVSEDGDLLKVHICLRCSGLSFPDKVADGSCIHEHERLMEQSTYINTRPGCLSHCLSACIHFFFFFADFQKALL